MPQISITIAGRAYRVACEPGQEKRLEGLGHIVDEKISEMRGSFGEIGDQRLIVMAALSIADEASEAQEHIEELETRVARMEDAANAAASAALDLGKRLDTVVDALTAGAGAS